MATCFKRSYLFGHFSLLVLMMWMWFLDFWKMTLVTQAVDASLTWKIALLFINKPLFTATKARRKKYSGTKLLRLGKNNLGHTSSVRLLVVKIIYENWIFVFWFNSNVRTNVWSNNILSILRVWFGEGGSRTEQWIFWPGLIQLPLCRSGIAYCLWLRSPYLSSCLHAPAHTIRSVRCWAVKR